VKSDTATKLLALNRLFYQTFALQFSSTRTRLQPGVRKLLGRLTQSTHILDLGCGNGNLAQALASITYPGTYLGLDNNLELLEQGRKASPVTDRTAFVQADLAGSAWSSALSFFSALADFSPFDVIVAFAVLHHLPGEQLRLSLLKEVHAWLAPGGCFIHSEWQFLHSPHWRARIQPWEMIGLTSADVDPDDYLLDWRRGGRGLRYVHHFSRVELDRLAEQSGFSISETFASDGKEDNLGLYQVWDRV
jgi:tRNA (uracil-5-)-methyltransferase TRM9